MRAYRYMLNANVCAEPAQLYSTGFENRHSERISGFKSRALRFALFVYRTKKVF